MQHVRIHPLIPIQFLQHKEKIRKKKLQFLSIQECIFPLTVTE